MKFYLSGHVSFWIWQCRQFWSPEGIEYRRKKKLRVPLKGLQ
jgi:hypothetical protein